MATGGRIDEAAGSATSRSRADGGRGTGADSTDGLIGGRRRRRIGAGTSGTGGGEDDGGAAAATGDDGRDCCCCCCCYDAKGKKNGFGV